MQPYSHESEMIVLGTALIEPTAVKIITDRLGENDFYSKRNRFLFVLIREQHKNDEVVDYQSVEVNIKNRKMSEQRENDVLLDLLGIQGTMCALQNLDHYVKKLLDASQLRRYEHFSGYCRNAIISGDHPGIIFDKIESEYIKVSKRPDLGKEEPMLPILSRTFDIMDNMHRGIKYGYETGIDAVDELCGGFQMGDLSVIAGRPSQGKTALAVNVIINMAKRGVKIGFFSVEMSKEQICFRMMSSMAELNLYRVIHGLLPRRDFPKLSLVAGPISEFPIQIDDTPGITINWLRAAIRRMIYKHGIQIILVDHLHLMDYGKDNPTEGIGKITSGLKAVLKEEKIAGVLLSQLSRIDPKGRKKDLRPTLQDLRLSGNIEQDADLVMFVHREEMYTNQPEDYGVAEIIIAKQRNGPVGTAKIMFKKETATFYEGDGF